MKTETKRKLVDKANVYSCRIKEPLYRKKYSCTDPQYHFEHITIYCTMNVGDTVLSTCIRDLFNTYFQKATWKLTNLFDDVDDAYISRLNTQDMVVVGGHGAFLPDTHPNEISGWEWACSKEQYNNITSPLLIFAVGYNYFEGQERTTLFEENIEALVRKSAFFGLRNRGSVREIQSFLPDELKDKVVYQPCPTMISRYLYPSLPKKKETRKIAFNVALDRAEKRMGKNKDLILTQIAEAMYRLYQRGYEVHFVTHMSVEISFLDYLDQFHFPYKFDPTIAWDVKKALSFYNEMDVVIGMRGHGIWLPFGVNCQILSLGNQNKTRWFLEDIHAEDWFIDINSEPETLADRIVDKFIEIHEVNAEYTTRRLLEAQRELYDITRLNMENIQQILSETQRGGYNEKGQLIFFCNHFKNHAANRKVMVAA